MGPFFINLEVLKGANATDDSKKAFVKSFKSKVLMYLYEDVAKMNPGKLFSGCGEHPLYSTVCEKFDEIGEGIFGFEKTVLDELAKIKHKNKENFLKYCKNYCNLDFKIDDILKRFLNKWKLGLINRFK